MLARRTFLLAAGAAATGRAAEKPIRTAIYGVGHAHAAGKVRTLRAMSEYEVVGVCGDDRPDLLDKPDFADLPRLSARALLHDPSIEMIAVESDVQHGLAYAHEAVDAGKFVHLDKPPGEDLDSLRRLFAKAEAAARIVQMGYMWRYHLGMGEAIRMARAGELGDVYMVRAAINKPISLAERRELAAFRGGMMFELGCHMLDRVVDLLGPPQSVRGILRHDAPVDDGLADNTLAILEYDRAMAEVYIAAMQPGGNQRRTFQILGTKGTATVRPFSPDGGLELDYGAGPQMAALEVPKLRGPYDRDFQVMAGVIRRGDKVDYSAAHDLAVQETLLRACNVIENR